MTGCRSWPAAAPLHRPALSKIHDSGDSTHFSGFHCDQDAVVKILVGPQHGVDRELLDGELARSLPVALSEVCIANVRGKCVGKRRRISRRHERSRVAWTNELQIAAGSRRDDGQPEAIASSTVLEMPSRSDPSTKTSMHRNSAAISSRAAGEPRGSRCAGSLQASEGILAERAVADDQQAHRRPSAAGSWRSLMKASNEIERILDRRETRHGADHQRSLSGQVRGHAPGLVDGRGTKAPGSTPLQIRCTLPAGIRTTDVSQR